MICFAWEGFPQYAARCVGAYVKSTQERVVVLATRPSVPVEGMEESAGCEVHWVPNRAQVDMMSLLKETPRCLFSSAWHSPAFSNNWVPMRRMGSSVFGMMDNNYEPTLKCFINGIRFRLLYKRLFDGFMVPGNSGVKLLRSYGVEERRIVKGMYRADAKLFKSIVPVEERPKRILFTGRLNKRKNVLRMCKAFLDANTKLPDGMKWTLDVCGTGELAPDIPESPYIVQYGFVQPEQIAAIYQQVQCFILPSLSEHWGVVVHEAALSGCMLLLSDRIGSADDFLSDKNGARFNPYDTSSISAAFYKVMTMSPSQIAAAGRESLRIAKGENLETFVAGVDYCLNNLCRNGAI